MSDLNAVLEQRLNKKTAPSKMMEMAQQTVQGQLSSFSGVFSFTELNAAEKEKLRAILEEFAFNKAESTTDLNALISLTSEIKAINNQAAILHGERIKKAHTILTKYRDGAFTSWLIAAYGNRQTPYNFLQYYEFYELLPKLLRPKLETMPRQAVYTLASRQGPLELKKKIVENYQGETKAVLLDTIREYFPLADQDKRKGNAAEILIQTLSRTYDKLKRKKILPTKSQKQAINNIIDAIKDLVS
jgi:hypothetical protein